jgi:hypothetical protein
MCGTLAGSVGARHSALFGWGAAALTVAVAVFWVCGGGMPPVAAAVTPLLTTHAVSSWPCGVAQLRPQPHTPGCNSADPATDAGLATPSTGSSSHGGLGWRQQHMWFFSEPLLCCPTSKSPAGMRLAQQGAVAVRRLPRPCGLSQAAAMPAAMAAYEQLQVCVRGPRGGGEQQVCTWHLRAACRHLVKADGGPGRSAPHHHAGWGCAATRVCNHPPLCNTRCTMVV